jgi:lactate dehydrogenase-like 2-hydroxyacid dehydrogenase
MTVPQVLSLGTRHRRSESRASRQVHQLLVHLALVLVIVPVPGLRQRWVPDTAWVVWGSLGIQTASLALAVWGRCHLGSNWSPRALGFAMAVAAHARKTQLEEAQPESGLRPGIWFSDDSHEVAVSGENPVGSQQRQVLRPSLRD